MKICLTCSHGGHLTEIQQLLKAFEGHDIFYITYEGLSTIELKNMYTVKNIGYNPLKMLITIPYIYRVLSRERPNIIISTGSEIAIPVFYIAKLLKIKTMYIESLCRVKTPSGTGRIVYPVSNIFLVQWKPLLQKYGKKAQYWGNIF